MIRNCLGYGTNQVYTGQYVAPQAPTDDTAPAPYQQYQSSYGIAMNIVTYLAEQDERKIILLLSAPFLKPLTSFEDT